MERVVEQSYEDANVQLNLFQEEAMESIGSTSFHICHHHNMGLLQEVVRCRIKEKMEVNC